MHQAVGPGLRTLEVRKAGPPWSERRDFVVSRAVSAACAGRAHHGGRTDAIASEGASSLHAVGVSWSGLRLDYWIICAEDLSVFVTSLASLIAVNAKVEGH
jgi:hypothetical protein